jgi:hypothetical protein
MASLFQLPLRGKMVYLARKVVFLVNDERRLLEFCLRPCNICNLSQSIPIEVIKRTEEMRYIKALTLDSRSFQITDSGRARLETLLAIEQRAQEQADEAARQEAQKRADDAKVEQDRKKNFRHDWAIAVFSTIGGSLFGAILDHFFDVVGNCARFFASFFP